MAVRTLSFSRARQSCRVACGRSAVFAIPSRSRTWPGTRVTTPHPSSRMRRSMLHGAALIRDLVLAHSPIWQDPVSAVHRSSRAAHAHRMTDDAYNLHPLFRMRRSIIHGVALFRDPVPGANLHQDPVSASHRPRRGAAHTMTDLELRRCRHNCYSNSLSMPPQCRATLGSRP